MWYDVRELSTRDQNDTVVNNYRSLYVLNNEQRPYCKVSYKRPGNEKFNNLNKKN